MRFLAPFIFLSVLFSHQVLAAPAVEFGQGIPADLQEAFHDEISRVASRSFRLAGRQFSPIKKINDSYQLTAQAVWILLESGDVGAAIKNLQAATGEFRENRFANLLLGYAYEKSGRFEEARRAYGFFYEYALTLAPLESKLIGASSLEIFQRYVEAFFMARGIEPPKPRVPVTIQKIRSAEMIQNTPAAQTLNLVLPFAVVGGFILLMLVRLSGMELNASARYFLTGGYLLFVLAYAVWAAHFFLGLPFLFSPKQEFTALFTAGALVILLIYALLRFLEARKEMREEGNARCPHCKKPIFRVAAVCPRCGASLSKESAGHR